MTTEATTETTYRIETTVSGGSIEDPVTGDQYQIEPHDDDKGGFIEVARPDSARYIVDSNRTLSFDGKAPSENAVRDAQEDEFGFSESELAIKFTDSRNMTFGEQKFAVEDGFDPVTDATHNDPRMKVYKAYQQLKDSGREDAAAYLRALTTETRQEQFAKYVHDKGVVSL